MSIQDFSRFTWGMGLSISFTNVPYWRILAYEWVPLMPWHNAMLNDYFIDYSSGAKPAN